ncbi:Tn3 family transposase [Escherichia coli]|uniref:Tn3 family transposase n=1 Tax=Escherichia coli TaxID=562 RepID=UPI003B3B140B
MHAGLNKGEARNSLAGGVLQPPWGNQGSELRAAALPGQRPLNLVTAAIVLWNTVYTERATQGLVEAGKPVDGELLQFLSPLAGLGAHQPNRRLRLAAEPQTGRREVSAPYGCPENLSVRFFPNSAGSPI